MLSVSLSFRALAAGEGIGSERFLDELHDRGVQSIEFRTVTGNQDPQTVLAAADRVWRHGMRISVHTAPRSADTAVQDMFRPLEAVLKADRQDRIILVLHPVNGVDLFAENLRMLDTLVRTVRQEHPCAMLALENNRFMPDRTPGDSADLVMRVIRQIDPDHAGLCFDFGHYAWVTKCWETDAPALPPEPFLSRVIHTHIHALYRIETGYTTHFPLQSGVLPLRKYIESIRGAYHGACNIELEPERFTDLMSGEDGILGSVELMKQYGV